MHSKDGKIIAYGFVLFALGALLLLAQGCTTARYDRMVERPLITAEGQIVTDADGRVVMVRESVSGEYRYALQNKENTVDFNGDGMPDVTTKNTADPAVEIFKAGVEAGKALR